MRKGWQVMIGGLMLLAVGIGLTMKVNAQTENVVVNSEKVMVEVLARPDCPHCLAEEEFLDKLAEDRQDFITHIYNIYNSEDKLLWEQLTALEGLSKVTPITIIGNDVLVGFGNEATTGKRIMQLIAEYQGQETWPVAEFIARGGSQINRPTPLTEGVCDEQCEIQDSVYEITVPLINKTIDVKSYSLPVLSMVLGFVDGFNPCAMWVLVSFLVILAQVGSRKKMWLFAGTFVLAEAIMYTLILTVWFTAWDFVGLDNLVTPIVGLVAIGGGCFFLYEWKTTKAGECKVTNIEQRQQTSQRIRALATQNLTILTLLGIILLAFSVNVIEFACSIGIPQAFTKILELNSLNLMQSGWYIFLYILFYMVDDFLVFGIAFYSFEKIGVANKYARWSNLIGGVLMLILGSLLIFKPSWLMFS